METVEQILNELSARELAVLFDVITKLPKTGETTSVLNSIMEYLEKLTPIKFSKWLKQTNGASMRKYF